MAENKGPLYIYCHTCEGLIAICSQHEIAVSAEKAHRDHVWGITCVIATGHKQYFKKVYPDVKLDFK